jgi:hypothetical protein
MLALMKFSILPKVQFKYIVASKDFVIYARGDKYHTHDQLSVNARKLLTKPEVCQ